MALDDLRLLLKFGRQLHAWRPPSNISITNMIPTSCESNEELDGRRKGRAYLLLFLLQKPHLLLERIGEMLQFCHAAHQCRPALLASRIARADSTAAAYSNAHGCPQITLHSETR
jgi:hypothetical protein